MGIASKQEGSAAAGSRRAAPSGSFPLRTENEEAWCPRPRKREGLGQARSAAAYAPRAASAIAQDAPTTASPPTGPVQSPSADQSLISPAPMPADPRAFLPRRTAARRKASTHAAPASALAAAAAGSPENAIAGTRAAATSATHALGISRSARSRAELATSAPTRTTMEISSAMFPNCTAPPLLGLSIPGGRRLSQPVRRFSLIQARTQTREFLADATFDVNRANLPKHCQVRPHKCA